MKSSLRGFTKPELATTLASSGFVIQGHSGFLTSVYSSFVIQVYQELRRDSALLAHLTVAV